MKTRPILFSQPMVQAMLAGTKTMTRRTSGIPIEVNKRADEFKASEILESVNGRAMVGFRQDFDPLRIGSSHECPYGNIGDVLWIRETWAKAGYEGHTHVESAYRASGHKCLYGGWKPSIHMPKEAARIWLKITDIRVERLQVISAADAIAEGVEQLPALPEAPDQKRFKMYLPESMGGLVENATFDPVASFYSLWISQNGERSVLENPWVWVISFKQIEKSDLHAS